VTVGGLWCFEQGNRVVHDLLADVQALVGSLDGVAQDRATWQDEQFADLFPRGATSDTALQGMIDRVVNGGDRISFNLEGMKDIPGILSGKTAAGLNTSIELRYVCGNAAARAVTTFYGGDAPC